MELFKIFGTIGLNDAQAKQGLKNIDNQAANTEVKLNGLSRVGGLVGKAIAVGAAAAVGGISVLTGWVAKTGFAYNAMSEQSQVAWKTLLGSQEEAKKMLQDIAKFAKATPFETEQVDQMAKYMHNAGLEGQALFDELMKVSDVASAFSIPAAEAKEMTRQMSQVRQAGFAYTEDLNILADRGVPIYQAISKQLGVTVGDVKKMASEGKITSDIYLKAFDSIAKGAEGASKAQSQTFSGMMSTLKDNLSMISGELMKGAFEKFKGVLDNLMPVLERFGTTLKDEGLKAALSEVFGEDKVNKAINLFNTVKDIGITAFNGLKDTVKFVSDNFNILLPILVGVLGAITAYQIISTITNLMNIWKASTIAQTFAQGGLNAVMMANPIGLVVLAIGLLIAAGVALYMNWDKVTKWLGKAWDWLKEKTVSVFNSVVDFFKKWGPLILTVISGPIGWIVSSVIKNWDSIKSKTISVWNSIKSGVGNAIDGIKGFFTGLWDKAQNIIGNIKSAFGNIFSGKIRLPHFKLRNWSANPLDWIKNMPSIGIEWYAKGTNFAPGGLAVVGERGPELVELPRGSKVRTANETQNMLNGGVQKLTIEAPILLDGQEIGRAIFPTIDLLQANQLTSNLRFSGVKG